MSNAPIIGTPVTGKQTINAALLNGLTQDQVVIAEHKVVRLRNESDDVFQGDLVPLVLTAKFRSTTPGDSTTSKYLFEVTETGELMSQEYPMEQAEAADWVTRNYSFVFTLKSASSRQARPLADNLLRRTDTPWIRMLDTSGLQSDLVQVEGEVTNKVPDTSAAPIRVMTPEATARETFEAIRQTRAIVEKSAVVVADTKAQATTAAAAGTQNTALLQTSAGGQKNLSDGMEKLQKVNDAILPAMDTHAKQVMTLLDNTAQKLSYGLGEARDVLNALARTVEADDKKSESHMDHVTAIICERIAETREQVQRLTEKFEQFARIQARLEAWDWAVIERIAESLEANKSRSHGKGSSPTHRD